MESLYRKYRPQTFQDVVGQKHVVETLERAVVEGLRTDSLYLGPVRVSQALSLALVLFSLIVLLLERRREHPAEKLYGNRVKDAEKEEKPAEDTKKEEA